MLQEQDACYNILSICIIFPDLLDENKVSCTTHKIKAPKSQY